jgi:mycothione reductase
MLVYTADVAQMVRHAGRFGIGAEWAGADWPTIRDRVFGRIDPLPDRAVAHRRANGYRRVRRRGSFPLPEILRVGDDEIRADRFVLATGSRPRVPPVPGLAEIPYRTSDDVMRLDTLPKSMAVLGGGYIAAEMSHVFGSLGTVVTIVERGQHLLSRHDVDIRARFTEHYRERFDLRRNSAVQRVSAAGTGVSLDLATPSGARRVDSEVLLVAAGRRPNSDLLDVAAAGIEVDAHGHVCTDDTMQTSVPGIWALGDLANHSRLKHMANAEARVVWHNIAHPGQPRKAAFPVVPAAVFADPQVASAGATEQDLQAQRQRYIASTRPYRDTAYGWALQDTRSLVKVLADPGTRLLLGAHIMARRPRSSSSHSSRRCAWGTPSTRSPPAFSTSIQRSPRSSSRRCSSSEADTCLQREASRCRDHQPPGVELVGDGADDGVGAGAQDGRQEQASLVLQDPVTPPAWLDLGGQDGDLPVALLCLPDVVHDRVDQRAVRAAEGVQPNAGVPVVPFGAEGGALRGFGVDTDGDDVVAEGQRCVQGVFGELADAADGYDYQVNPMNTPIA